MELSYAVLLLALAVAGSALLIVTRRATPPATPVDQTATLQLLRSSIDELRTANASALGEMRTEMQRTLGATEQQVMTQTGATQRSLHDLSRQLGVLSEQSARVGELAKDIGSL